MDLDNLDKEKFLRSVYKRRLLYFWLLKRKGYQIDPKQLEEAEIDAYPNLVGVDPEKRSLNRRDIDELQFILWFEDPNKEEQPRNIKATLFHLGYIRLIMRLEQNHGRPHFHIEYKKEYNASYAIDTLEKLAGDMPPVYEKPMIEWAKEKQKFLGYAWDDLKAGKTIRGSIWEALGNDD